MEMEVDINADVPPAMVRSNLHVNELHIEHSPQLQNIFAIELDNNMCVICNHTSNAEGQPTGKLKRYTKYFENCQCRTCWFHESCWGIWNNILKTCPHCRNPLNGLHTFDSIYTAIINTTRFGQPLVVNNVSSVDNMYNIEARTIAKHSRLFSVCMALFSLVTVLILLCFASTLPDVWPLQDVPMRILLTYSAFTEFIYMISVGMDVATGLSFFVYKYGTWLEHRNDSIWGWILRNVCHWYYTLNFACVLGMMGIFFFKYFTGTLMHQNIVVQFGFVVSVLRYLTLLVIWLILFTIHLVIKYL